MRRRELIVSAGAALLAWPLAGRAQPQAKVVRLGYLGFGTPAASATRVEALRAGLRDLGYVEGKNLAIEFRWAVAPDKLNEAAADLVRMDVDIIFAISSTESEAARRATSTIPIVFATHADPEGVGHVSSLARPGGNMTGLADIQTVITPKRLEVLAQAVPRATRFGALSSASAPSSRPFLEAAATTARKLGIHLVTADASTVADFDGAFAAMARDHVGGVLVHASSLTVRNDPRRLADVALKHRLPTMFGARDNVATGGLMSYAPDHFDLTRRSAIYIDKILKGARPAELPVEQASKYLLTINLRTGKALGLPIPPALLARADEVIE